MSVVHRFFCLLAISWMGLACFRISESEWQRAASDASVAAIAFFVWALVAFERAARR